MPRPVCCVDDAGTQLLVAVLSQDLDGLVEAEGRQADFQRPPQPRRGDAGDHPMGHLVVPDHHLAAGGDGLACCLAGTGLVGEHRSDVGLAGALVLGGHSVTVRGERGRCYRIRRGLLGALGHLCLSCGALELNPLPSRLFRTIEHRNLPTLAKKTKKTGYIEHC
ncbi:hypothetical protein AAGT00_35060, partial [Streptomyces cavourensis]